MIVPVLVLGLSERLPKRFLMLRNMSDGYVVGWWAGLAWWLKGESRRKAGRKTRMADKRLGPESSLDPGSRGQGGVEGLEGPALQDEEV